MEQAPLPVSEAKPTQEHSSQSGTKGNRKMLAHSQGTVQCIWWTFLNDSGRITEPKEPSHILVSTQYNKEAAAITKLQSCLTNALPSKRLFYAQLYIKLYTCKQNSGITLSSEQLGGNTVKCQCQLSFGKVRGLAILSDQLEGNNREKSTEAN